MRYFKYMAISLLSLSLLGCKHSEVTTEYMSENAAENLEEKGRKLLEESIQAMGYDKFNSIETYQANAVFNWRFPWSAMPMNPLPGAKNKKIQFRFLPNSFDGQVEYLEGSKKGSTFGLQSWIYYKEKDGRYEQNSSPRREWALATYHYLLEGPFRLLNADIVQYAGQADYNGITYELVFATWNTIAPHSEHDQWLLYIHPETKLVDLVNATIREYFLPFPKNMAEGTVLYKREKHESGIYFPTEIIVQLMTPKKENRYVYKMQMSDYEVDAFKAQELKPLPGLEEYGDAKPLAQK